MRRSLLLTALALCAVGCSTSTATSTSGSHRAGAPGSTHRATRRHRRHHHRHRARTRHKTRIPAIDLPNHRLTPGVALHVGVAAICRAGYASRVRDVPTSESDAVYARYGIAHVPYRHEVDHLISLEVGGSNSIRNLWPEPYAGRWGARTKDVLEDRLHQLVCSRRLSLRSAQRQEASNWVAAYRRYVGAAPRPGGNGTHSASRSRSVGGYYASRYGTASTIYCADDATWRELSRRYLVHFATLLAARRRFPGYHLHQPC